MGSPDPARDSRTPGSAVLGGTETPGDPSCVRGGGSVVPSEKFEELGAWIRSSPWLRSEDPSRRRAPLPGRCRRAPGSGEKILDSPPDALDAGRDPSIGIPWRKPRTVVSGLVLFSSGTRLRGRNAGGRRSAAPHACGERPARRKGPAIDPVERRAPASQASASTRVRRTSRVVLVNVVSKAPLPQQTEGRILRGGDGG